MQKINGLNQEIKDYNRQIDRPIDRPTDRPTNRQTDMRTYKKLHFQKCVRVRVCVETGGNKLD